MSTSKLALIALCLAASPALASQEEIHLWKAVTLTAPTSLFGDVEVKATANAKGNLETLALVVKGKTITVPARWIATLPAVPLASIEIRSERGYDKDPWLYAFFRTGPRTQAGSVELHIAVQGGKLVDASLATNDGKGNAKRETRKAP